MPPQTHPAPSKLHHPPFTRITLSNGYRAYRLRQPPATAKPAPAAASKPKKTVRFLDGHVTIPDANTPVSPRGSDPGSGSGEPDLTSGVEGRVVARPGDTGSPVKRRVTVSVLGEVLGEVPSPAAEASSGGEDHGVLWKRVGRAAASGRDVGESTAWRKIVRFRGSGRVRVLDEPVRDGREIAELGEGEWWLTDGKDVGGGDGGEAEMTLESVFKGEEGGYTVRYVGVRGGWGKMKEVQEKEEEVGVSDGMAESVALTEAGPESESEDEFDCLFDFSAEEAEGWVPVMVAEEYGGDEWMSLTGSWMLMRGPGK